MAKYLVFSWDKDEQQAFHDVVVAKNAEAAEQLVADVRDYAEVTESWTLAELRKAVTVFERVSGCTTRAQMAAELDSVNEFCRTCDAPLNGDDGWDGECGNCADKTENRKQRKGKRDGEV